MPIKKWFVLLQVIGFFILYAWLGKDNFMWIIYVGNALAILILLFQNWAVIKTDNGVTLGIVFLMLMLGFIVIPYFIASFIMGWDDAE